MLPAWYILNILRICVLGRQRNWTCRATKTMHLKSPHPPLDIPKTSILDFIYPPDASPPDFPLWIDAKDPSFFLTPKSARQWICRLGQGLERKGIKTGDVCLVFTPNHIFVPVAYLGIVSMGAIFSGLNPSYTVDGEFLQVNCILIYADSDHLL